SISPERTRGEALFMMDMPSPPLMDLAGVAALVTDGKDSAVEFEISCSEGLWGMNVYFGRVHIGEIGVSLATTLCARESVSTPDTFKEIGRNEVKEIKDRHEAVSCSGYLDSWKRRQGIWTLLDSAGRKRLETSWKDGRLSGAVTNWDEKGRRRELHSVWEYV